MKNVIYRLLHFFFHGYKNNSKTVRYAFPLLFTTLSLIGAAIILPTDASYIRIESDTQYLEQGDNFFINVYAGAHVPINAVNIELKFPTDKMEVFAIDTGGSVITLWTEEPYVSGDKIIFSGGTYRRGFLGEHLVATVKFTALSSGRAEFTTTGVEMYAGDGSGSTVSVEDSGGESLVVLVESEDGVIIGSAEVVVVTDVNGDGVVNMTDIISFMSAWRNRQIIYDFNRDNRMNFVDFAIILADSFYH